MFEKMRIIILKKLEHPKTFSASLHYFKKSIPTQSVGFGIGRDAFQSLESSQIGNPNYLGHMCFMNKNFTNFNFFFPFNSQLGEIRFKISKYI